MVVFTGNTGMTHYSYCLAGALAGAGSAVTLITNENYELGSLPAAFPVVRLFGRTRRYPSDLIRFWRRSRRERPDILHYQGPLKYPVAELPLLKWQRRSGSRLVFTVHDWLPHHRRFYHKWLFRLYYRAFDRVIVHSPAGRKFLINQMRVRPEKISVIPHGNYSFFNTNPDLNADQARDRLGLEPARFWFLFFGQIAPHKGLDAALEALSLIPDADDDRPVGLLVAGSPGEWSLEPYKRLITERGLAPRVSLHIGHISIEEVQLYVKAADAMVLPYRESSTSGVIQVALGFAKPVVATAVGGMTDVVQNGVTGLMAPPGDIEALATAMRRLARDEGYRRRLAAGWASTGSRFSWDKIARLTLNVYASMPHD